MTREEIVVFKNANIWQLAAHTAADELTTHAINGLSALPSASISPSHTPHDHLRKAADLSQRSGTLIPGPYLHPPLVEVPTWQPSEFHITMEPNTKEGLESPTLVFTYLAGAETANATSKTCRYPHHAWKVYSTHSHLAHLMAFMHDFERPKARHRYNMITITRARGR